MLTSNGLKLKSDEKYDSEFFFKCTIQIGSFFIVSTVKNSRNCCSGGVLTYIRRELKPKGLISVQNKYIKKGLEQTINTISYMKGTKIVILACIDHTFLSFQILSSAAIAVLPSIILLLISSLQSPPRSICDPKKVKLSTTSISSPANSKVLVSLAVVITLVSCSCSLASCSVLGRIFCWSL